MPKSKRTKKSKERQRKRVNMMKQWERQQKNLFRKQIEEHQARLEAQAKEKVDELAEKELEAKNEENSE